MTDHRADADRLVASMVERMARHGAVSQPELVKTIAAIWESIKSVDAQSRLPVEDHEPIEVLKGQLEK